MSKQRYITSIGALSLENVLRISEEGPYLELVTHNLETGENTVTRRFLLNEIHLETAELLPTQQTPEEKD